MDQRTELKHRVEAKKKKLEARLEELKADTSQTARENKEKIEKQLSDVKQTISQGWDKLTDDAAAKLNKWLQ